MQDENSGPGWEEARLRFAEHLFRQSILVSDAHFLLAVSGGMDSMCMLALFDSFSLQFAVAHVDYGLRGEASDADAALVRNTCLEKSIVFHEKKIDVKAVSSSGEESLQQAGRRLRYAWFEQLRQEHHYDFICTAHHQNDSAETFFVHLIRGTGLKGLTGIPVLRGHVLRPLLCFSRAEIAHLVHEHKIPYRDDASNFGREYLRNRIRHEIIPLFEAERPSFVERMHITQQRLLQEQAFLDAQLDTLRNHLCTLRGNGIALDLVKLLKCTSPAVVLHSILKDYGFSWLRCQSMVAHFHASGTRYVTATHELFFDRNALYVQPLHVGNADVTVSVDPEGTVYLPDGALTLQRINTVSVFGNNPLIEHIDAAKIHGKLELRHWLEGDFFYPFGMKGKQKLQDFFTNQKISVYDRQSTWILTDEAAIIWIVGMRLDDRFRVTTHTTDFVRMEWRPTRD